MCSYLATTCATQILSFNYICYTGAVFPLTSMSIARRAYIAAVGLRLL